MTNPHIIPVIEDPVAAAQHVAAKRREARQKEEIAKVKAKRDEAAAKAARRQRVIDLSQGYIREQRAREAERFAASLARAHAVKLDSPDADPVQVYRIKRPRARIVFHIRKIARRYGVNEVALVSHCLNREVAAVRFWAIKFVRRARPDMTVQEIGRIFDRDHSTIVHALKRAKRPKWVSDNAAILVGISRGRAPE